MKNTSHHEKTDLNKAVDNYGGTAIYKASAKSLEEVMELVEMGADVNIPNNGGNTPIHIATVSGKYDIFVYLAKNGANLYSLDNQREGLLSKAVDKKQTQIVKYLLQNTNQNASNLGGLLIKAVKYGLDEMAIDLIELGGADANITTQEGQNLLQLSLNSNNEKLIKYFVEDKKLNVNHTDGEGKTVLFYG